MQTCTGDKDQATFNLKLALKLSGAPRGWHSGLGWGWCGAALCSRQPHRHTPARCSPPTTALLRPRPPARRCAGQASVLSQEVDQLKRMLKAGAAWDVVSQMMSYISDKAAQVHRGVMMHLLEQGLE